MTNLGAGFPVGSPETTGPPPPSSSGPPSERDRYERALYYFIKVYAELTVQSSVGIVT